MLAPHTIAPHTAPRMMLKRISLATATTLLSLNVWTGFPLLALWIGSRFAGSSGLSMSAVFIVIAVLASLMVVAYAGLNWLSAKYNQLTARPAAARQPAPWLRSLRGERNEPSTKVREANAIERIVVITVVAAVIVFEVWFFVFAGSSLPKGG